MNEKRQNDMLCVAMLTWLFMTAMFSAIGAVAVVAWNRFGFWSLCIAPVLAAFGAVYGTVKVFGSDR